MLLANFAAILAKYFLPVFESILAEIDKIFATTIDFLSKQYSQEYFYNYILQ